MCQTMKANTKLSVSGLLSATLFLTLASACITDPVGTERDSLKEAQCTLGEDTYCEFNGFRHGSKQCEEQEDGSTAWGECQAAQQDAEDCDEGETWNGSCCVYGTPAACCADAIECNTPLVLSFDDRRVSYTSEVKNGFDLTGRGMSHASDWPTAATPWLVLDRNGNGQIDDGSELFGSASPLSGGETAQNGFVALAEFDDNHDGRITPEDSVWSSLQLWSDHDASRTAHTGELSGLAAHGLIAIELDYTVNRRCDDRLNCENERARFVFQTATGALRHGSIIDVHLPSRTSH